MHAASGIGADMRNKGKEKAPAGKGEGKDTRKVNQMSTNIVQLRGESPFDAIKQTRSDGS